MKTIKRLNLIFASALLLGNVQGKAQTKVDFVKDIQPILQKSCIECHGPEKQKGKLRLDSKEASFKGGKDGVVIVPKEADKSELYRRITLPRDHDDIMPNKGEPLTKAQTDLIRDWINQGAEWPDVSVAKVAGSSAPEVAKISTAALDAADLRATAAQLRATAERLEATAARIEMSAGGLAATKAEPTVAQKAPSVPPPPTPKIDLSLIKPTETELKAIAELAKLGVAADPIAMNTQARKASFRQQGTNVTDATLAPLKQMTSLVELNLASTKITDAGLENIVGLTNLMTLHLENTVVTDAGLKHLKGLTNLTYLNLYGTSVSDAGLDHLRGLVYLRNLYLWQTKVTDQGVATLQKTLPYLKVSRGAELIASVKKPEKEETKK